MKKPPDQVRDEFVRQWLLRAEEDLNAAKSLISYGRLFYPQFVSIRSKPQRSI